MEEFASKEVDRRVTALSRVNEIEKTSYQESMATLANKKASVANKIEVIEDRDLSLADTAQSLTLALTLEKGGTKASKLQKIHNFALGIQVIRDLNQTIHSRWNSAMCDISEGGKEIGKRLAVAREKGSVLKEKLDRIKQIERAALSSMKAWKQRIESQGGRADAL